MVEYQVKRYSVHTGLTTNAKESNTRLQNDMNEMAKDNWRVISTIELNNEGTVSSIRVTYERVA